MDHQKQEVIIGALQGYECVLHTREKVEKGKTDKEALVRELSEELSITIDLASIMHTLIVEAQAYNKPKGVHVVIRCYNGSYSGTPLPGREIQEMKYFSFDEYLGEPESAPAVRFIFKYLAEKKIVH